jgi:hypothetical protein
MRAVLEADIVPAKQLKAQSVDEIIECLEYDLKEKF